MVFYLELYNVHRRALNLFFLEIVLRRPSLAYRMVLVLVLVLEKGRTCPALAYMLKVGMASICAKKSAFVHVCERR